MIKCVLIFTIQIINFDSYLSTNASNLQQLLQSKMSRITKRSPSENNRSFIQLKNGHIRSNLKIPLELILAKQLSSWNTYGFKPESRGNADVRSKRILIPKDSIPERIDNASSEVLKSIASRDINQLHSRNHRYFHQDNTGI